MINRKKESVRCPDLTQICAKFLPGGPPIVWMGGTLKLLWENKTISLRVASTRQVTNLSKEMPFSISDKVATQGRDCSCCCCFCCCWAIILVDFWPSSLLTSTPLSKVSSYSRTDFYTCSLYTCPSVRACRLGIQRKMAQAQQIRSIIL